MFLQSASNSGAKMSHVVLVMPGQPKVRDLGDEISIEQDIAGFDVPVHYPHAGFLVEISQASSNAYAYLEACSPI